MASGQLVDAQPVCMWHDSVHAAHVTAVARMAGDLPQDAGAAVCSVAPPDRRGCRGLIYEAGLKRAYFVSHGLDGILTCVTFDGIESAEVAERLYREIEAAWPVTLDDLLTLQGKVTRRGVKAIAFQ